MPVDLELAADLSSEAFIAVLTRFVARRGCPNAIWTDNGSNFVGAQRKLQEIYTLLENQQTKGDIINFLNARRITWYFSPGRAPHHGGIWELSRGKIRQNTHSKDFGTPNPHYRRVLHHHL